MSPRAASRLETLGFEQVYDYIAGKSAVYGVEVRVAYQGVLVAVRGAKLVVDCASGLLRAWVGPALAMPPNWTPGSTALPSAWCFSTRQRLHPAHIPREVGGRHRRRPLIPARRRAKIPAWPGNPRRVPVRPGRPYRALQAGGHRFDPGTLHRKSPARACLFAHRRWQHVSSYSPLGTVRASDPSVISGMPISGSADVARSG